MKIQSLGQKRAASQVAQIEALKLLPPGQSCRPADVSLVTDEISRTKTPTKRRGSVSKRCS